MLSGSRSTWWPTDLGHGALRPSGWDLMFVGVKCPEPEGALVLAQSWHARGVLPPDAT